MPVLETTDAPATACAWCGAPLGDEAVRCAGRTECARCGVATTDPWPSPATLDRAYAGWYRPDSGRFSGPGDALLRRSRGALARRLDRIAPPGPVLDVGAGDGALLDALRKAGREATGIERESTRDDVAAADILDIEPGDRFAAIVFWHSLEHLPAPGQALDRAAALLRPGGVIVVAVPNADSLQARAFGDRWLALDLPRHLTHITASALLRKLESLGLRIARVSHVRGGQIVFIWLHGLVGLLPGRPHLYDAIRRPEARSARQAPGARLATLAAATLLAPVAAALGALEAALRRGGTVYVEAVRG
jgi:2-polyprenyl-3-methyl-5-hydroxy-6-metoxy-1,4-benzoquinol methylase